MASSYWLGDSTGRVAGRGAAEDLVDVDGGAAELLGEARRVRHEAARLGELPQRVDARQPVLAGLIDDALPFREQEGVSGHQQRIDALPAHRGERGAEILPALHLDELDLHPEGLSGGLVLAQAHRRGWAAQHGHARDPRHCLLEELELLGADLGGELLAEAGDIAPGPSQAGDEPRLHGIGGVDHDDRDRRRRSLGRERGRLGGRDDHVHLLPHEVGGHLGEALPVSLGPAVLDDDVLALDMPELFQAVGKHRDDVSSSHRVRGHQYPDAVSLRRRLGMGNHR